VPIRVHPVGDSLERAVCELLADLPFASLIGETEDRRLLALELLLLPLRHHGRTDARLIGSLAALTKPYWSTLVPLAALRIGSSRFLRQEDTAAMAGATAGRLHAQPQLRVVQGGRA
jgi:hypothetical protein